MWCGELPASPWPSAFCRDPPCVPGTAAGLSVGGSDRCASPLAQAGADPLLLQTRWHVCTVHTHLLMRTPVHITYNPSQVHVIYVLTYVLHMLLSSHTHLHSTCLLTRSMGDPSFPWAVVRVISTSLLHEKFIWNLGGSGEWAQVPLSGPAEARDMAWKEQATLRAISLCCTLRYMAGTCPGPRAGTGGSRSAALLLSE